MRLRSMTNQSVSVYVIRLTVRTKVNNQGYLITRTEIEDIEIPATSRQAAIERLKQLYPVKAQKAIDQWDGYMMTISQL